VTIACILKYFSKKPFLYGHLLCNIAIPLKELTSSVVVTFLIDKNILRGVLNFHNCYAFRSDNNCIQFCMNVSITQFNISKYSILRFKVLKSLKRFILASVSRDFSFDKITEHFASFLKSCKLFICNISALCIKLFEMSLYIPDLQFCSCCMLTAECQLYDFLLDCKHLIEKFTLMIALLSKRFHCCHKFLDSLCLHFCFLLYWRLFYAPFLSWLFVVPLLCNFIITGVAFLSIDMHLIATQLIMLHRTPFSTTPMQPYA